DEAAADRLAGGDFGRAVPSLRGHDGDEGGEAEEGLGDAGVDDGEVEFDEDDAEAAEDALDDHHAEDGGAEPSDPAAFFALAHQRGAAGDEGEADESDDALGDACAGVALGEGEQQGGGAGQGEHRDSAEDPFSAGLRYFAAPPRAEQEEDGTEARDGAHEA